MSALMEPLYIAVSAIMVAFHSVFEWLGLDPASGVTWALSIVGLVVVIRTLLIPLFVKQIKAQRGLQQLQPELRKIQERHKGDRERLAQEQMKLYKETGTNPLSSCLPILAQAPIFFALFGVLNGIPKGHQNGVLTQELVAQASNAEIFGAKIFDTFLRADNTTARIVALVLIVLMCATTFTTQKQLMSKNMPASAMTGPFAQQQKILLYVFPLIFAFSGVNFPIGVLIYWFTTNLWTLGQQLYVINRMPAPGSLAEQNLQRRRAARAAQRGDTGEAAGDVPSTPDPTPSSGGGVDGTNGTRANGATRLTPGNPAPNGASTGRTSGQRQQPRRQPRSRRR